MSFLDMVKGVVGDGAFENAGIAGHAMELVNDPRIGGVSGLVQKFHDQGLGGVAESWIGTGGNQPITAEQITSVIGEDHINAIAGKLGVPPEEASAKLAEYLPMLVDKLTPHGEVPPAQ
jgi:uncharacterized protein YidB (DUF937 family)